MNPLPILTSIFKSGTISILCLALCVLFLFTGCEKPPIDKPYPELQIFTVFFDTGEEEGTIEAQLIKEGEKVKKPENPTRDRYLFVSWCKEEELVNEWRFDTDVVESDIVLFAKWEDWKGVEDPLYPTVYYRLSEETLLQLRKDFEQRNPDVCSTLNHFGFCEISDICGGNGVSGGFTKEEAITAVMDFVARNPEYTGVSNPGNLQFRIIDCSTGYNNALFWNLRTENQIFNGIVVDGTELMFNTRNWELREGHGNHFPDVYVPKQFNFNVEQAKSILLGKDIVHLDYFGKPFTVGIVTSEHLRQSISKLIIVPIRTNEKIELRVAWQIRLLPPLSHIFEVDVMTREIIREKPTAIS